MEVHPWTEVAGGGISASCGIICLLFVFYMLYCLIHGSKKESGAKEEISLISRILKPQHILRSPCIQEPVYRVLLNFD
jgi:hypothetical protein